MCCSGWEAQLGSASWDQGILYPLSHDSGPSHSGFVNGSWAAPIVRAAPCPPLPR